MSLQGRETHARGCRHGALAFLVLGALAAHGCAPLPAPPTPAGSPSKGAPRPVARPRAGYEARVDSLATADAWALKGRRIAIDPGHGGVFRGALGVHGLTEAEVNLGVALHLRGLLEARGAIVLMTRTDDRDFLTPADSSLRSDLAERMRLANDFHPDLFVSVHHNADARGAHDKNETQTYYKLSDDGPSLDAARSVHRFLVRNLGIEQHRILPGNYFVLRNSVAPGILTESSYITNPDVESKLALAAKQRLEAEAIYLGLARYFALPRPTIEEFVAMTTSHDGGVDSLYQGVEGPVLAARIDGPCDFVSLTMDDHPLPVFRTGGSIRANAGRLAPGPHVATLTAGFAGGGAAQQRHLTFTVTRPTQRLELSLLPFDRGVGDLAARVTALDGAGFATNDSLRVRVSATGFVPPETTITLRDREGWAYFKRGPAASGAAAGIVRAQGVGSARAMSATGQVALTQRGRLEPRSTGFARLMPGDSAMRLPTLSSDQPAGHDRWINRDGFVVLERTPHGPAYPQLPGYRPWPTDSPWPPRFTAIAGGALIGKRVVLDPDGGGDDDAGTGPSGTRAANLNLDVARALASFLTAAGADVRLTRDGDFALSDVERVQASEAFHAERFVRIGHRAERPMIGYYFSSAVDKRWAERTAATLASLGLPAPRPAEDAQYVLQQTSCPSIFVDAARVDDVATEDRLATPAGVRAEAYALYLAVLGEWRETPPATDSLTVADAAGHPVAGAAVTLGGSILLFTGADGRVRFARTEPGPLDVDVDHPAVRAHRVLLDSMSGVTVTGNSSGP